MHAVVQALQAVVGSSVLVSKSFQTIVKGLAILRDCLEHDDGAITAAMSAMSHAESARRYEKSARRYAKCQHVNMSKYQNVEMLESCHAQMHNCQKKKQNSTCYSNHELKQ